MRQVVLDASVVVKWLRPQGGPDQQAAADLEAAYRRGEVRATVPYLLFLELINVAALRWGWPVERLAEAAEWLAEPELEVRQPPLARIAFWAARA